MSDDEYYDEYYDDGEYYDDDVEFRQEISYTQLGQISSTHHLLNGTSFLSDFAEQISISINNVTTLEGESFINFQNQILNFIEKNSKILNPVYYKNTDMFVIAFMCIDRGRIDKDRINQYSKNHNINDIIRYTVYLESII